MPIAPESQQLIATALDSATSKGAVPGVVFVSVDRNGKLLTSHCSGTRGAATKTPMDLDTVFWIASCTKMITGIACMQLVEQGKLSLDDHEQLYKHLPELREKKVLQADGNLVPKTKEITLRMLLNHTAGFGYTFFNEKLMDYERPMGLDEFCGDSRDILDAPLVNQPGETWEYGTNIDWAGMVVERISGMTLNDYFHEYIFEPIGLQNISMFPTESMLKNLAYMHQKKPNGTSMERDHLLRRSLSAKTKEEQARIMCSGGAGCFAKPTEYCQILATLLNDGQAPNGTRILSKETVDSMFTNTIPDWPDFSRSGFKAAKTHLTNAAPELYPQPGNPPQGWGLTFLMTNLDGQAQTWRGQNCAQWAGLANLFWWADREKGIAGMIASQVLPFGELDVIMPWYTCEQAVYDGLKS